MGSNSNRPGMNIRTVNSSKAVGRICIRWKDMNLIDLLQSFCVTGCLHRFDRKRGTFLESTLYTESYLCPMPILYHSWFSSSRGDGTTVSVLCFSLLSDSILHERHIHFRFPVYGIRLSVEVTPRWTLRRKIGHEFLNIFTLNKSWRIWCLFKSRWNLVFTHNKRIAYFFGKFSHEKKCIHRELAQ